MTEIPSNEGGIEKGVEQHAVRMVQRGNDVTVYNRGGHNVFGKEFDGKKLREYCISYLFIKYSFKLLFVCI